MAPKKKKDEEVIDTDDLKEALGSNEVEDASLFVSTNSTLLDYALANRPNGGIPFGRITEIVGENQAGKTLIGTHILANVQRMGGIAVCIDTEHDLDKDFSMRLGVTWDKRFIYRDDIMYLEDVFEFIEKVITTVRTNPKYRDLPVVILWDSLAATPAKAEAEDGYDPTKSMGLHARIVSKALRKIRGVIKTEKIALVVTNQLREKIGVMFGDPMTTSHGKAMSYYASNRMRLYKHKVIENDKKEALGVVCQAKVFKNKVGPPNRVVEFPIMYDWGVDDETSIHDFLFDLGYISGTAWKKMNFNGEEIVFRSSDWKSKLNSIPGLRDYVMKLVEKHSVREFVKKDKENINLDSIMEVEQFKADLEGTR